MVKRKGLVPKVVAVQGPAGSTVGTETEQKPVGETSAFKGDTVTLTSTADSGEHYHGLAGWQQRTLTKPCVSG